MAMVALNVLSLLFVHGALPKKSTVWAFSFYFNNVTLRFRKLFCYWSQILNLGSNSDTFTNESEMKKCYFHRLPGTPPPLPLLKSSRVAILGVLCLWMVPLVLFLFFPDNLNTKACNSTPCLAVFLDRIILISWATNYCNCTAVCFMFLGACVG